MFALEGGGGEYYGQREGTEGNDILMLENV
jgi:hypothetical protein